MADTGASQAAPQAAPQAAAQAAVEVSLWGPCPKVVEKRVLVIYTGGTIGMKPHGGGLEPEPNALLGYLRKHPTFHDEEYAKKTHLYDRYGKNALVLPVDKEDSQRIVYIIEEYDPLLDSSNMTPKQWAKIGTDIKKNYERYDGFVVLHGTDTMAYTASALSFMCEHLGKPVILTGSQVPIYTVRNDGRDNLLGALLIAGQFVIPEVGLYFYNRLFRGNRVTKVDAESFNGFNSPNLTPLATAETDITVDWDIVWREKTPGRFDVSTKLNQHIALLRLFPGITAETVKAFLQPPMKGVVLETYGAGNAPNDQPDFLAALKKATDAGVIIVNCTQCLRGTVSMTYATGQALLDAGVISGGDMTPEAALTKLSHVLAKKDLDLAAKKKMMCEILRGEMSADIVGAKLSLSDGSFIQALAKYLSISSKEDLKAMRDALTPPLACAAAKVGDTEALKAIREMGGLLPLADYDGRTPLHVACCEGDVSTVQYLLSSGASVHAKDRYGATALGNAVRFRHRAVVELLKQNDALFSRDELDEAGVELCSLSASGDLEGLRIWSLAGADLTKPGYDGQNALQVAEALGKHEAVTLLRQLMNTGGTDPASGN